ncbi:MAG: hypothetical protein U9N82_12770 [Thermodesulfobacteriota bacterium]|nr:hypothetical protein [Thermodesulfobacteriota bacterium]
MILSVTANLKEIEEKGRNYQWVKPKVCLRCRESHLWGHGFVESWFDGYVYALLLRRYRCPLCGCVIKLKPKGYLKHFQTKTESIRFHIVSRLKTDKWPEGCSISARCRHWLRALKRQTMAHLGIEWMRCLSEAFDRLIEMGKVPVSRAI